MNVSRDELHHIIDELPEWALDDAAKEIKRIEKLTHDPVYKAFMTAPLDDEPLTPEEEAAIAEACDEDEELLTLEEVRERFTIRQSR